MTLQRLLTLPFRYRPWRPDHIRLIFNDFMSPASQALHDHKTHLAAAMEWLCRAQDVRAGHGDAGGVSAGWNFEDGWLPSYPETTGYIIETFIAAAQVLNQPDLVRRSQRMIDWELSIQRSDGAFPGHFGEPGSHPVIFNTGQIMHGVVVGYLQVGRQDCLEAAVRAGWWLAKQQDEDGGWRRFEYNGIPHVYNTRATWALLRTALLAGERKLRDSAVRNLDWALTRQRPCGWFATNSFTSGRPPFTHTIAYAIRGFLESGLLLGDDRYLSSAVKAAHALARMQRADGWLAGTYDEQWVPRASYCCLTGVAQMSINWTRIAQSVGAAGMREAARRGLEYLKRSHRLQDPNPAVRGGIAGSLPIWGRYSMFEFPSWAVKFFADALMMDLLEITIPPLPQQTAVEHPEQLHV